MPLWMRLAVATVGLSAAMAPTVAQVTGADLTVSALSAPPPTIQAGGIFGVTSSVTASQSLRNVTTVNFYLSSDGVITNADIFIGAREITRPRSLVPSTGTITATLPATIVPGTYYLGALVDPYNTFAEPNESNNSRIGGTVQVTAGGADLTITALGGAPTTAAPGGTFTLTSTVAADPSGSAGPFTVGFYLSSDPAISTADIPIGSRAVAGLGAGQSSSASTSVTVPLDLPAGTYWVGVVADSLSQVIETNEANNAAVSAAFEVGSISCVNPPSPIDDGNPCTVDSCDPVLGIRHVPAPAGTACSDGNACNGEEFCDGAGACAPGTPPVVDDGSACTIDFCDPVVGVTHVPSNAGTSCSDGSACNGEELCDGGSVCRAGVPPQIDDGNPCTSDACDPVQGVQHLALAEGASCSDGNACNGLEVCGAGANCLAGTAPVIDDGNRCTSDFCDPLLGVQRQPLPVGSTCSDGSVCNGAETCDGAGACRGGAPPIIDDGNPCTVDTCITGLGVQHAAIPGCAPGPACVSDPGIHFAHDPAGNLTAVLDTASDPLNCGCEGRACPGVGAACADGICGVLGPDGFIDTSTDVANCGAPGNACAGSPYGAPVCRDGLCGIACRREYAEINGRCMDLINDPQNCGWLGNVCTASAACVSGVCATTAAPVVYAVNGVAPPGVAFRNALLGGIRLVGANLDGVLAIDVEDWGADTVGGMPDGEPSAPVYGWTYPTLQGEDYFTRSPTIIDIPTASFPSWPPSWPERRWLKLRLHYLGNGLGEQLLVEVAVSLDPLAPISAPPPTITSVDAIRVLKSYIDGFTWGYNPATGFLAIGDPQFPTDLTALALPPKTILGNGAVRVEYPVLAVVWNGVYVRAGIEPERVIDYAYEESYASVVFHAGPIHLKPDYRSAQFPSQHAPGVILRGTDLFGDGSLRLVDPTGATVLGGDLSSATFLRDRIVVEPIVNPDASQSSISFDSARGMVGTTLLEWLEQPVIDSAQPPYLVPGSVTTLVGRWLSGVTEVSLAGAGLTESYVQTAGAPLAAGQFRIVDDQHIEVAVPESGDVPRGLVQFCRGVDLVVEPFPGARVFWVASTDGRAWVNVSVLDPAMPMPSVPPLLCSHVVPRTNYHGSSGPSTPSVPIPSRPRGPECGGWGMCAP